MTDLGFHIKADTPEQYRDQLIDWLNKNAAIHRVKSSMAARKTTAKDERIKAETYSAAAGFIANIRIERKTSEPK